MTHEEWGMTHDLSTLADQTVERLRGTLVALLRALDDQPEHVRDGVVEELTHQQGMNRVTHRFVAPGVMVDRAVVAVIGDLVKATLTVRRETSSYR